MIYIERLKGQVTEAREKPLSPVQDALAQFKLLLSRWHLPGGYPFQLVASEGRGEHTPHQVIFADFKASEQPTADCPTCPACDGSLRWKPSNYSFTGPEGITATVPEIGWWKCSESHPGIVDSTDFARYAKAGEQFKQRLGGNYSVQYGKIIPGRTK